MSSLNVLYRNLYIIIILFNLNNLTHYTTSALTTSSAKIFKNDGGGGGGSSDENRSENGGGGGGSNSNSKLGVYMLRSPETTIAPQGDEVQFECELNLEPERLEWRFRSQTNLGDNVKNDYIYIHRNVGYNITTKDGTSKLRVFVSQRSIGEYQCIAWFGASAIASVPARLMLATIVLDSKNDYNSERKTHQRLHWQVSPGNSVIIKCGDIISYPQPVWNYYKNNIALPPTALQLASGGLIISPVSSQHSGTYGCSAVNSITGTEIKMPLNTTLDVGYTSRSPPIFLSQPPNTFSVKLDKSVILECPGVGNPIPKAVWSRPDGNINNNRTKVLGYGLQILEVVPEDQGKYVCRLDNGIAPVLVHTIKLIVLEPPIIKQPPRGTLTNETDSLELECIVKGSPKPEVYWMINGDDTRWDRLIKTNGSKLFIKSVEKKHAGIVQCFAKNEAGEVSGSNLLQVNPKQIPGEIGVAPLGALPASSKQTNDHIGKPTKGRKKHKYPVMIPPSRPNVTRLSDESVMVRWSVPLNEGLTIQFFKIQYRMLGDPDKKIQRSQWMTANEDIPPHLRSYEVDNLKPDHYYRFRIAAVYSNNDNKLGNTSGKFHLQRGAQLDPARSHLIAPKLQLIEPVSDTAIVVHWQFPAVHALNAVDGFIIHYRPATTAGEYSKATVDGMAARRYKIDHLDSGTTYEFKLQSFTSSAASEFSVILTGITLKQATPAPITPSVVAASETAQSSSSLLPLIAGAAGGVALLLVSLILVCVVLKRRKKARDDDGTESKSHPDHIQTEPANVFNGGGGRVLGSSPINKTSRLNGIGPRMNITSNPLAQESDKNRNVMELRFLPNTLTAASLVAQNNNCHPPLTTNAVPVKSSAQQNHHQSQQHHYIMPFQHPQMPPQSQSQIIQQQQPLKLSKSQQQHHSMHNDVTLPPIHPQRKTLDRSLKNLQNNNHMINGPGAGGSGIGSGAIAGCGTGTGLGMGAGLGIGAGPGTGASGLCGSTMMADEKMTSDGDCGVVGSNALLRNSSSMRRTRRSSGSVPGSPRANRGPSSEYLHHNRSPMPIRTGVKRSTRLGRAENISSGSLNSIEV